MMVAMVASEEMQLKDEVMVAMEKDALLKARDGCLDEEATMQEQWVHAWSYSGPCEEEPGIEDIASWRVEEQTAKS